MEEEPRKQTLETSQMVRETHQETSGALEEEQHKQTLETPNVSCERPSEATEANSKKQTLETPNVSCKRPSEATEANSKKQTLETSNVSCERPSEATEANSKKLYDCPLKTKSAFFGSVIDETYQEEHVRRLPIQRAIALRSPCGTGKTKATHELLKELSEKTSISVVWVVHRKALSREAQQKLPCLGGNEWKHYKDIEGPIDISEHALVIAQYESLSQITGLERTNCSAGSQGWRGQKRRLW